MNRLPSEERAKLKHAVVFPRVDLFVNSASDISKERSWETGAIVGVKNGANWDICIFNRTGSGNTDGYWLIIGTTTGTLTW